MNGQIAFFNPSRELLPILKDLDVIPFEFELVQTLDSSRCETSPEYSEVLSHWKFILQRLDQMFATFARKYDEMQRWETLKRSFALRITQIALEMKQRNFVVMLFPTSVAHHPDTVCLKIACEILNIKQVYFYTTPLSSRLIVFEQNKEEKHRRPVSFLEYEYKLRLRAGLELGTEIVMWEPWYTPISSLLKAGTKFTWYFFKFKVKVVKDRLTMNRRKQSRLHRLNYPRKISWMGHLRFMFMLNEAKKFYLKNVIQLHSAKPITTEKNSPQLFLFAHFQPEATTYAEGNGYNSHVDLVAKLRDLGYKETIYYREHPATWYYSYKKLGMPSDSGSYRSRRYYQDLLDLGCKFTDSTEHGLTDNAIVATVVGSVAIERARRGLPTIYFGSPWWQGMPNTYSITGLNDLEELDLSPKSTRDVEDFLMQIFTNSSITNGIIGLNRDELRHALSEDSFRNEFTMLVSHLRGVEVSSY